MCCSSLAYSAKGEPLLTNSHTRSDISLLCEQRKPVCCVQEKSPNVWACIRSRFDGGSKKAKLLQYRSDGRHGFPSLKSSGFWENSAPGLSSCMDECVDTTKKRTCSVRCSSLSSGHSWPG